MKYQNTFPRFALLGRKGAYPKRYAAHEATAMYKDGVAYAREGDMLQVWETTRSGDLLRYDATRTRKLTDKIVKDRGAPSGERKVVTGL